MSKYYGKVGYADTKEDPPGSGIWVDVITEKNYYGDVMKDSSRWTSGSGSNDDMSIDNRISILADPYAYENCHKIKYVEWMSQLWKVTSIEVERPRLILGIGGVWNGEQA